jgi:hypothetical protein
MVKGGRPRQQRPIFERELKPAINGIPHGLKVTNRVAFLSSLPKLVARRQRFCTPGTTVMSKDSVE